MKTKIQMIAMAVSLLAPLPALSATEVSVTDTVAGLGTEINVSGAAATSETELRVYPPYGSELILPQGTLRRWPTTSLPTTWPSAPMA